MTSQWRRAIVRFVAETMIAVDGGEIWANDSGGGGPPLVLLHPGIGDSRIWEPVLPADRVLPGYPVRRSWFRPVSRADGEVFLARRPDHGA